MRSRRPLCPPADPAVNARARNEAQRRWTSSAKGTGMRETFTLSVADELVLSTMVDTLGPWGGQAVIGALIRHASAPTSSAPHILLVLAFEAVRGTYGRRG